MKNNFSDIDLLVNFISKIKESEIISYEEKIIYLKHLIHSNPENKVYKHRYVLAKMRFDRLIQTSKQLKHLEIDINKNEKSFRSFKDSVVK